MKTFVTLLYFSMLATANTLHAQAFGLALHGGAGNFKVADMDTNKAKAYTLALQDALEIGYNILAQGGTAEAAVIETIVYLENNPLFNAGRGSVLNSEGQVEMDASIMLGHNLQAGSVAGVRQVKNPIKAAAAVMHKSPHVMLAGRGADDFAKEMKLETARPSYFITEAKKQSLQRAKAANLEQGDLLHNNQSDEKFGTVGVVALDKSGNLAAGTSTGGMTNKMHNRIGDSPIIGAGTYANNRSCAVSCTGHGEYFIRLTVAKEVSALMQHKGYDLEKATSIVIHKQLTELGGEGGLIAIDKNGRVSMPFNTYSMFRAFKSSTGETFVGVED